MKAKKSKTGRKHQSNVFQLLMFRYFPYWPLFAGLAVIMLCVAWAYLQIASPVYRATATILIKDEKKGVENPGMMESLNIYTSKKIVENEIEVIKSKTLMGETVEILHLSSPVFEEGFISDPSAYTSCPLSVETRGVGKILESEKQNFFYNEKTDRVLFGRNEYELNTWIASSYGEIRFVKNVNLQQQSVGPFYFSVVDARRITNALLASLSVLPSSKLSTIVNLSINDAIPVRAENILNTLIDTYNKASMTDKNSLAANTLIFIEERIKLVEHDLDSIEQSIQSYKSQRGIVDLSEQGKLFLQNVGDTDQKLSALNMQIAVLDKVENYVVGKNNSVGIAPSTLGVNDARLSVLIQKLYESEIQYERLKKTTAENNPILLSLQNEIENMRPGILENIRNQKLSLIASRGNLASTNSKYASVLETIPKQERELLEANRQQLIKNNVYTFLLQKREETALSQASSEGDSRLVDKAESTLYPVAPNKMFAYAAALAMSFLLGIGWVTFKDLLSNKVLFRSEVQALTQIPIVAELPHSGLKSYIVIDNPKKPFLTEQFRQLLVAVGLYGKSNTKKVIMITSGISGEGKSFVCANLATSLARARKKTLLLDLDLRNPRLTNFFKTSNKDGAAEFLLGTADVEGIIGVTKTPNLFIIGSGKDLRNPTEALMNGNLQNLFESLRSMFDYIIVDTAPIDPVADAYAISPYCDSTLFILRHGKTPKTMVQLLDENKKIKVLNNISIVFNGVRSRGLVKNTFGYGYGYGYEYDYSNQQPR